VRWRNLGLLIIDEEQHFGVAHKERLKKMRTQVDVLTLTATPIPRTLHMAMTGMRDLSIIATPPADRRSIRTFVCRPDDAALREGIRRELARGGQVFFVAPRIVDKKGNQDKSLEEWATHLAKLTPEARIAVAHGQMPSAALEKVMVGFVAGDYDVLCSTTIIESGLDIARANTMFVVRADRFGLAQLYQLRGRIGRSRERAFCYLLVPPPRSLTDDARRRLEALQRFTDLGAGFLIASHDLEIRGAGELLGAKQSGSIAAVGFETYTAMLEEAVAELKGEEIHRERDPELNVEVPGYIPDDYVPDTGQRLDLYKRLSAAQDPDEVAAILDEISDRYGQLPVEVTLLGDLMVLKGYASKLRAQSLELTASRLALALGDQTPLSPERVTALIKARGSAYRLTPDMRLLRVFSAPEQKAPLQTARGVLLELLACAT
jgi:transcription-repair coupling factor (superfamily II helicase)